MRFGERKGRASRSSSAETVVKVNAQGINDGSVTYSFYRHNCSLALLGYPKTVELSLRYTSSIVSC